MSCCCTNPTNLGCLNICSEQVFNLFTAAVDSEFTFILRFLGTEQRVVKEFLLGEDVQISSEDFEGLNENFSYELIVYKSLNNELLDYMGCWVFSTVFNAIRT